MGGGEFSLFLEKISHLNPLVWRGTLELKETQAIFPDFCDKSAAPQEIRYSAVAAGY